MARYWVIVGAYDRDEEDFLYWSNEDGWGSYATATVFTGTEQKTCTLPIGGRWKLVYGRA